MIIDNSSPPNTHIETIAYNSVFRSLLTVSVFPLILFGTLTGGILALHTGVGIGTVVIVGTVIGGSLIWLMEWIHPHSRLWQESRGDVLTDFWHLIFTTIVSGTAADVVGKLIFAYIAAKLSTILGSPVWPNDWPLAIQLAMILVATEFPYYWYHRLAHEREFFWRLHATHHSVERLYWFNANRFHPLDTIIGYLLQLGPMVLLGVGEEVIGLFALFTAVHGMFQHSNIRMRLGPLNWIFSMAELHRWHHSRDIALANANYGANIILWDIVFGTRFLPRDREHDAEDVGIEMSFPPGYWQQFLSPFRWRSLHSSAENER